MRKPFAVSTSTLAGLLTGSLGLYVSCFLILSGCGQEKTELPVKKIPAAGDAQLTMGPEAAALQLAEFDLNNAPSVPASQVAGALSQVSFPKTILLGPGSTEVNALQILPAQLKIMASACDNVMPALDQVKGRGETLTFDFGYDYSVCAKRDWERDGSKIDNMKYQVSQHLQLTCPGANYDVIDGMSLQELESKKLTKLLACNYNGTQDISYTFKLLFVTIASGTHKDGTPFSADQRISKMLSGDNGPCVLNSQSNIVNVKQCFQSDRARTTLNGFSDSDTSFDIVARIDMSNFTAPRNQRYYSGANPASIQVNDWVGSGTFDGTPKAALTLSNGTQTFEGLLEVE